MSIQLTEKSAEELRRLLAKEQTPGLGLRMGVKGGGCSGLSYDIKLDQRQEGDHVFEEQGVTVYVDPKSYLYLKGLRLDFEQSLAGQSFKFVNPNAKKSCGCGESFSV